jgi:cytosine/adenosine deaminase-related metal-dependent hydrolase
MDSHMIRRIEGFDLDLRGLQVMPGLVNAHDHLEFALFPRLGHPPYADATEWARDIYHPERSPVREHLSVPLHLRLLWGGLRNLLAGATVVWHHNPHHPSFDESFPVRIAKPCGWAHSLAFEKNVRARWEETPRGAPFVIHAAEGTDHGAGQEIFRLDGLGVLDQRTVLIHGVGLTAEGWERVRRRGASVVWCPRSNLFMLGRTLALGDVPPDVPVWLGTDSPLTAPGDLLDEICAARGFGTTDHQLRRMLRADGEVGEDWIAVPRFGDPPRIVVLAGRIHLIDSQLAERLGQDERGEFFPLHVDGRPPVLVRWNLPRLMADTRAHLDGPVRLGGREVLT